MAFAQLTYRESLRDIESCLRALQSKLYHMGFRGKVSRSTLADANESHDWRIFAEFAQVLIGIARPLHAHDPIGVDLDQSLYAWIRRPSICACRYFRGRSFVGARPPSECILCWTCTATFPRSSASPVAPQRLTTQARQIDDAQVLQGFKATLMNLELKRTELLTKFQPTYPLVQEVDKQIADTRASIVSEESKPVREETTDRNPTYAWINAELAKAKAEHSGLQARLAATQVIVSDYKQKTRELEQKAIIQQNLLREMKTSEENYLLYQRKREEARMTDALDRTRIVNVAIAEQPTVPALPSNSPWTSLLVGGFLAIAVSAGIAFTLEYLDSSFRTPSEVTAELNIPVLAAVPRTRLLTQGNGNGSGLGYRKSVNGASPVSAIKEQDEMENKEKSS